MRAPGIFLLVVAAILIFMATLVGSMLLCFALFGEDTGLFVWVGGMVVFDAAMYTGLLLR